MRQVLRALLFTCVFVLAAVLSARAATGPASVLAIAVDPAASNYVYVASPAGLYRSENEGMRWTLLTSLPAGPVVNVATPPLEPGVVYVIAAGQVFKSADRGATWGATGQPAGAVLVVDPSRAGMLYAGGDPGTPNLVKSLDGGISWISVAITDTDAEQPGATVSTTVIRLLIDVRVPDVLYAVAETSVTIGGGTQIYDKVFKSLTGGAYWQAVALGPNSLAVSPHTSAVYYSVGATIFVSPDGGGTTMQAEFPTDPNGTPR